MTYQPLSLPWKIDLVRNWVEQDRLKRGEDAKYFRYTYIPGEHLTRSEDLNYARIGIVKALNSVAIAADDISRLDDISGQGVVFAIDLRKFFSGDVLAKWRMVAAGVPIDLGGGGYQDLAAAYRLAPFDGDAPIAADRLAYNLLHGGIYTALIDTPARRYHLESQLGVSDRTAKLAFSHGITYGVRYAERRSIQLRYNDGRQKESYYWVTYDPFEPSVGVDDSLIWDKNGGSVPVFNSFGQIAEFKSNVGSESYHGMKNGLNAYYLWGSIDQRRSRGDLRFVGDPLQKDDSGVPQDVITGFCAHCHIKGIQGGYSDVANAIKNGSMTSEAALAFWSRTDDLSLLWPNDRSNFKQAMALIVLGVSDGEASYNRGVIEGSDQKEPMYYLTRFIRNDAGDTSGLRRRGRDGVIPGLKGNVANLWRDIPKADLKRPLSFSNDVLPILNSTSAGKAYRCTSCHLEFHAEESISESLLEAIIVNSKLRLMPVGSGSDAVSDSDLAILELWRRQKFP